MSVNSDGQSDAFDTGDTANVVETHGALTDFASLKKIVTRGQSARKKWVEEADAAFGAVAGHQWDEEDVRIMDDRKQPVIVFNRIAPIIKSVCGLEVNNRQQQVFLPRQIGDSAPDEMITNAGKWVRDECGAEDNESESFRDAAICGEGVTESRMDYDDEITGKIVIERIDPREVGVNVGAKCANYSDRRANYRMRDIDILDARAMFPKFSDEDLDAKWCINVSAVLADGGQGNKTDYPNETRTGVDTTNKNFGFVRVIQIQWWERKPMHIVATENDNQPQHMTPEDYAIFKSRADSLGIRHTASRYVKKVYYQAFLGSVLLELTPIPTGFTLKFITAERDEKEKCFYGLVRPMLDPQKWANKWLAQSLHILNTQAKGGLLAERGAFENVNKAEENWSNPEKIVWLKNGGLEKIKERTATTVPNNFTDLVQFAITSMRDVAGTNVELLGQADRDQPASLEYQRKQSAMTILAPLFDALRRYRKDQGRLLLHLINQLPDGQLIRITEQGQQQYIPLVKKPDFEKYDVIVDTAPSSPNQKQAVWAMVMQLMQSGIKLNTQAIEGILKYSPLPEAVVADIVKSMGNGGPPVEEVQKQLQQAQQQNQQLTQQNQQMQQKIASNEEQAHVDWIKLQIDDYRAATERLAAINAGHAASTKLQQPQKAGADGKVPAAGPKSPVTEIVPGPLEDSILLPDIATVAAGWHLGMHLQGTGIMPLGTGPGGVQPAAPVAGPLPPQQQPNLPQGNPALNAPAAPPAPPAM